MTRSFPAIALLALGCTPQSATMTEGQMWGFMSETTSFSLISGDFDPEDARENWNIDCREIADDDDRVRLDGALEICDGDIEVRDGVSLEWPPEREIWLDRGAFRAFNEEMDPWRGEGFITFEGDLQVGFHTRVPGGEDFRFQFAIDPRFGPSRCVEEDGQVVAEAIDGDWIEEWSNDISEIPDIDNAPEFMRAAASDFSDGTIYYLNGQSFQYNPNDTQDVWSLPQEWQAGFAAGSFIDEDLISRGTYWAEPQAYGQLAADETSPDPATVWYAECPAGEPAEDCAAQDQVVQRARRATRDVMDEFLLVSPSGTAPFYRPILQDNRWRSVDGRTSGLDGWSEINHSWVMLDSSSVLEVGGSVTGAFQILYEGLDSQTRIIVQGRFEIPKVKKDSWGGRDLQTEKLEDAEIELCVR